MNADTRRRIEAIMAKRRTEVIRRQLDAERAKAPS